MPLRLINHFTDSQIHELSNLPVNMIVANSHSQWTVFSVLKNSLVEYSIASIA